MKIRIYQEDKNKFSVHPDEELVSRIANLLLMQDFCQVTQIETRLISDPKGSAFDVSSQVTTYTGLVEGQMTDPSASVKKIADLIAVEFNAKARVVGAGKEFLITDEEDAFF